MQNLAEEKKARIRQPSYCSYLYSLSLSLALVLNYSYISTILSLNVFIDFIVIKARVPTFKIRFLEGKKGKEISGPNVDD